jgi:fumarylacetoacetase
MNETHAPRLRSWVESANNPEGDFPIQNLPFGVIEPGIIGVAIGDRILNLRACAEAGLLPEETREAAKAPVLNLLMALPAREVSALRRRLSALLRVFSDERSIVESAMLSRKNAAMMVPVEIGDYTDFYASAHHAINVGKLFRPDNPLLPNYKWVPIAYHGRSSSIVISGTRVRRPCGQTKAKEQNEPEFGPSRSLDYELEAGFYLARGNRFGETIAIDDASGHLFGMSLVNDWSARDIQAWEYQPLGPFLGKNFATTVSAWVVTMEALEPFRHRVEDRPDVDPSPLPYLQSEGDQVAGAFDIRLSASITTTRMREGGTPPATLTRSNLRNLYWTPAQMLTHHASNGCMMRTGDLLATGTVSGPEPPGYGSLIEITSNGAHPVRVPSGEERRFLEDGDEIVFNAWCERTGYARIGFGECAGRIEAAR